MDRGARLAHERHGGQAAHVLAVGHAALDAQPLGVAAVEHALPLEQSGGDVGGRLASGAPLSGASHPLVETVCEAGAVGEQVVDGDVALGGHEAVAVGALGVRAARLGVARAARLDDA